MTTPLSLRSSWISQVLYKSTPDGCSYLAIVLKSSSCPVDLQNRPIPTAYLYGGPGVDLPSWTPGLLSAGTPKKTGKGVKHSPGRAYWRLLREKGFKGQKVEGKEEVERLKEMMK